MSISRIEGNPDGVAYYHVMSRTTGRQMLFGKDEKNVFAKRLRRQAGFAGIQVLTWCMMDNHFHILVRVPARDQLLAEILKNDRKNFWKHLRMLYTRDRVQAVRSEVARLERETSGTSGDTERAKKLVARYTDRMGSLSIFMRELKFSFTAWFNRKHGREGTLWMARFKSVLLEGDSSVLNKVAAYIDLNPIRAGLVKDPANYRWSGYGQAAGGDADARRGLSLVFGHPRNEWRRIGPSYRCLLYLEGVEVRDSSGAVKRHGISSEEFYRVTGQSGNQAAIRRLAQRVRYLVDGAAVGSREYLESVFEAHRSMFGPRRKKGAKKFRGPSWKGENLFALRDVR